MLGSLFLLPLLGAVVFPQAFQLDQLCLILQQHILYILLRCLFAAGGRLTIVIFVLSALFQLLLVRKRLLLLGAINGELRVPDVREQGQVVPIDPFSPFHLKFKLLLGVRGQNLPLGTRGIAYMWQRMLICFRLRQARGVRLMLAFGPRCIQLLLP